MLPASAFSSSDNTYLELVPISQKLYPIIVCNAAILSTLQDTWRGGGGGGVGGVSTGCCSLLVDCYFTYFASHCTEPKNEITWGFYHH